MLSYNVEALFDPVDDGNEYKEYSVAKGSWTEALYRKRIANLASAIVSLCPNKPDILLFQEIENERVLSDLADALGSYVAQIAAPQGLGSITVGILSKYPIIGATAHQYQSGARQSASARLLLEVHLDIEGIPLVVLNAHWKSKKEGAAETEAERKLAAALVRDIIIARKRDNPGTGIILGGDLNTNPDEYDRVGGRYMTALMPKGTGCGQCLEITGDAALASTDPLVLYSPWFSLEGFSYYYNDTRERIDNFLLTEDFLAPDAQLSLLEFSAKAPAFLLDEAGNPFSWNTRTGTGYSDHLPILLRLELRIK